MLEDFDNPEPEEGSNESVIYQLFLARQLLVWKQKIKPHCYQGMARNCVDQALVWLTKLPEGYDDAIAVERKDEIIKALKIALEGSN